MQFNYTLSKISFTNFRIFVTGLQGEFKKFIDNIPEIDCNKRIGGSINNIANCYEMN